MDQEKKRKGHSKINDQIKRNVYAWITRNPLVFKSPISNDCLKIMFYDKTEPQLIPKLLLQVSNRELHNSLVSDCLKDARDEDGKSIISYSALRSLLPPQSKKNLHVIRSCVVLIVAFPLKVYIRHCFPDMIDI